MTFCWAGAEPYRWGRQLPTKTVPFTKTIPLSVMNMQATLKQKSVAPPERRLQFLAPGGCALNSSCYLTSPSLGSWAALLPDFPISPSSDSGVDNMFYSTLILQLRSWSWCIGILRIQLRGRLLPFIIPLNFYNHLFHVILPMNSYFREW